MDGEKFEKLNGAEKLQFPEMVFLDYVNYYLTIKYMAECYNTTEKKLSAVIEEGKRINKNNLEKYLKG